MVVVVEDQRRRRRRHTFCPAQHKHANTKFIVLQQFSCLYLCSLYVPKSIQSE